MSFLTRVYININMKGFAYYPLYVSLHINIILRETFYLLTNYIFF